METKTILEQIDKLPTDEKMLIIEQTIKNIRQKEKKEKMKKAVSELREEYKSNKELTIFTDIDLDNFYETR